LSTHAFFVVIPQELGSVADVGLRALFKFVRNEHMHNLFEAGMITAYTILFRVARIRTMLGKAPKRD
jgi:hypothetical protein